MRIIGPPSKSQREIELTLGAWQRSNRVTKLFVEEILPREWMAATDFSIDPVGVVAQAIKETAGGRFIGRVLPEFYNPCGLKIRHLGLIVGTGGDLPLAHQMFPNWEVGCIAHVQHLCAYTGWDVRVLSDTPIVDPRYDYVIDKNLRLENWSDLGGYWAPSPTYGQEIEAIMKDLIDGAVPGS